MSIKLKPLTFLLLGLLLLLWIALPTGCQRSEDKAASVAANQTGVTVENSVISWANMKIDNPDLNLTDDQLEVVKYFDNDYFTVRAYENLQKYPAIFRGAQVRTEGVVARILEADDTRYQAVLWMNHDSHALEEITKNGDKLDFTTGDFILISGKQREKERLTVKTNLVCYGRYQDVEAFSIDAAQVMYPHITVNYTVPFGEEGEACRYDLETIRKVAQGMFGEVKIREPVYGKDFELDSLHTPQYFFYLVSPDGQSDENFTCFEFSRMAGGSITDASSTADLRKTLRVSADFNHYLITTYDTRLHLCYLEYYDRSFHKIWKREFTNVDSMISDYNKDRIYIAANQDLWILDTQTGENAEPPAFVGEKVAINVLPDGILLFGTGNKDNIMKTDLKGTILWKASADLEVTACPQVQILDNTIVANLCQGTLNETGEAYTNLLSKMVALDQNGVILSEFTDYEYTGW